MEVLELNELSITDEDLRPIERLSELRELVLLETQLRGPGLSRLTKLKKLAFLQVSSNWLTSLELRDMPLLHDVYADTGVENRMTCTLHDCPRLDRLDVRGDYATFDLRNVPKLLEFAYESPSDSPSLVRSDVSVTLQGAVGLHSLSIGKVGRLSLDFEGGPQLEWVRLVPQSFGENRLRGVPWLEEVVLTDEALADKRTKGGFLYLMRSRPSPSNAE